MRRSLTTTGSLMRRSTVQNVAVDRLEPVDRILPGISGRNGLGGGAETLAQFPVKQQFPHALVQAFPIALRNDDSILAILDEFRNTARLERDDRKTNGEGLEKNQSEGLLEHRWQNEDIAGGIVRIDFNRRHDAEHEGALARNRRAKRVQDFLFSG